MIWRFCEITPVPPAQHTTPRREPMRRFAFWELGLALSFGAAVLIWLPSIASAFGLPAHESVATTHAYDARNRLASTTTPELGVTSYLYDGANRLLETSYANLAKEVRAYDLAGQLISLKHERAGGTLHSELYEYDASGNRKKLTQNDGTTSRITTYTVDHADRLLTEANPDEQLEDTLDVVGNRTQRLVKNGAGTSVKTITYTINARDQVTQVQEKNAAGVVTSTETYGFDANGNRINKVNGAVTTAYLYDRRNRQLGSGTSRFELNDGDVRTARIESGNRTEMVMEGLKLQAEIAGGSTLAKYRWGLQLIGEKRGVLVKTILQDSLRSPLIIADQAGAISDRVRYTAAGEVRQRSGSSPMAFGFGGYLAQSGTDELYAFARTYAPGMGRFNESDPVRSFDPMMAMGLHRYSLGYGNSLKFVDPDGRIGIFMDGTWNDRNDPATIRDNGRTNVSELYERYKGQLSFYKEGIGTNWYSKYPCGATGCGFNARVDMAYERIKEVYNDPKATAEDKTIDIFGYSRGAAQSRALVSKLLEEGIPVTTIVERYEPSFNATGGGWVRHERTRLEKPNIRFVGLMDTVPARGMPLDSGLAYFDILEGYRQNLDTTKIGSVRHAVAAEEYRTGFDLQSIRGCAMCVLPANAEEVYFRGSHGNIGSGVGDRAGSDLPAFIPLAYLHREAREAGVPFAEDKALEALVGEAVFHWDNLNALIYDSRYLYESITGRRGRTIYYGSGSEELSSEEMLRRAYEQAQKEARAVIEKSDGAVKSEPPK